MFGANAFAWPYFADGYAGIITPPPPPTGGSVVIWGTAAFGTPTFSPPATQYLETDAT